MPRISEFLGLIIYVYIDRCSGYLPWSRYMEKPLLHITSVWPNGADFAPEALYKLEALHSVA